MLTVRQSPARWDFGVSLGRAYVLSAILVTTAHFQQLRRIRPKIFVLPGASVLLLRGLSHAQLGPTTTSPGG